MNELVKKDDQPIVQVDTSPSGMLAYAMQSGADMAQLEKFMDLKDRWEKNEARKSYVRALSDFRSGCPDINKTKKGHNCKYAGLAETISQIKPVLAECGLSHSWVINQDKTAISVKCTITHIDGHFESTEMTAAADGSGNKNSIQAIGSTISYLERYTLYAILGLASMEMDDNANTAGQEPIERISEEQVADLQAILDEIGGDIEKRFLKWLQTDDITKIQASFYDKALAQLESKRQ